LFKGVPNAASRDRCMMSGRPLFSRFGRFCKIRLCKDTSSIVLFFFLPFLLGVLVIPYLSILVGIVSREDSAKISVSIFPTFEGLSLKLTYICFSFG